MNSILQLFTRYRLVQHCNALTSFHRITKNHFNLRVHIMAQRSIKSFFKVSPPKPLVEKTEVQVNGAKSAVLNKKEGKVIYVLTLFFLLHILKYIPNRDMYVSQTLFFKIITSYLCT